MDPNGGAEDTGGLTRLQREVLAYLEANPAARDSAEGVAAFWVAGPADVDRVRRALRALAAAGRIGHAVNPDGTEVFHAAPRSAGPPRTPPPPPRED